VTLPRDPEALAAALPDPPLGGDPLAASLGRRRVAVRVGPEFNPGRANEGPHSPEERWLDQLPGEIRRHAARADDIAVRVEQGRVYMAGRGRQPVWGAEEANTASMRLAESLGFERRDRLALMSRPC